MRGNIRVEDLRSALAATTIWQIEGQDKFTVRLGSSLIEEWSGEVRRGKNFFDLISDRDKQKWKSRFSAVLDTSCGIYFQGNEIHLQNGGVVTHDTLMFPVIRACNEKPSFLYHCADLVDRPMSLDHPQFVDFPLKNNYEYIDIGYGLPS